MPLLESKPYYKLSIWKDEKKKFEFSCNVATKMTKINCK